MVAFLIMVGRGQEYPAIVQQMLAVDSWGSKPQYDLADDVSSPPPSLYELDLLGLHLSTLLFLLLCST